MKRILRFFGVLAVAVSMHAQGPDEQYVQIYQLIQEADRLNESGQGRSAAAKYIEAQDALTRFRGIYPGWNERVINYRLGYVATKLAPLSAALAGSTPAAPVTNATGNLPSAPTNIVATPTPSAAASFPTTTPPVVPLMSAEVENQIKSLQGEVASLQLANRELAAKLREALSVQPAAMDPRELAKAEERIRNLQKENELFKAQLAQKNDTPAPPAPSPELLAKLNEQTEAISALRAENEVLKAQGAEWRQKHEELSKVANAARSDASQSAEAMATVQKLNASNIELQKQVELWKQAAAHKAETAPAQTISADAERERAVLRARLDVLEAKPVPYTPEELALFAKTPPSVASATNERPPVILTATKRPPPAEEPVRIAHGIPSGAGTLVRAAERAFAAGRYDEAEQKYLDVLRQEPNNVTTLANVASAQLEVGRVEDAEKNVRRALELDPNDHFALYLLGRIRFRQDKLDEALDALSRSAKANPDYADTQNYLGIVLSEKGLRAPAETALRRAIQLQPNNAVAHNNLAVVYATQKPPALALARWHYKKARDAGHPANPDLEKLLQ